MRRALEKTHGIAGADLSEPDWQSPGEAYFVQRAILKKAVVEGEARKWEDSLGEWTRVGPLRCENAAQVAGYLERGLRFRPPGWLSKDDPLESVDGASETRLAATAPSRTFECRHGPSDVRRFGSWKAYLRHCQHFEELPREEVPDEVAAEAQQYEWFCFIHGVGFKERQHRQMEQHMTRHKIRTAIHPPLWRSSDERTKTERAVTSGRGPNKSSAR
jgi:hypothetical protein